MIVLAVTFTVAAIMLLGFLIGYLGRPSPPPWTHDYEGTHAWGEWSKTYGAPTGPGGRSQTWQERKCQCGNRDFRKV
jgi:hypothetical protein